VWTYRLQLWGCTKQNNIDVIQLFQNKVLRNIVDSPWYIRNSEIHRDLQMNMVTNEIRNFSKKHKDRLLYYVKFEAIQLLENSELVQRLKKTFLVGVVISKSRAQ
jgi:hypothetical protein